MADDNRLVYAWTLRDAGISRSTKKHLPKKSERVVKEPDNRSQVPPSDIRNGGRFRPVVKVRTVMGDWIHNGTGWLIREDLVVTAGHIVVDVPFEQCKIQTFATIVQVYIGYRGKDAMDAMDSPDVDFRKGTRVVVPWGYAVMKKSVNDFAFVQLNQPFRNVSPIEPRVTPPFGTAELCVVGYPTDKKKIYVDEEEEDGAEMYEDSAPVTWRLERHQGLLAYQISTEAGNSGSPVLYEKGGTMFAIGTHVESHGIWNFASPITEKSVNSYRLIIDQFFIGNWPVPHRFLDPSSFTGSTDVEVHRLHLTLPPRRRHARRMKRVDGKLQRLCLDDFQNPRAR